MSIGHQLLNVPMGDMIRQMAFAIAEAQLKLDESSIEVAEMMGGLRTVVRDDGTVAFDDSRVFFGHEYMSPEEALKMAAVDDAISGIDSDTEEAIRMVELVERIRSSNPEAEEIRVPTRLSMLELGFTPVFYNFVDTIIEVKISIQITREREWTRSRQETSRRTSRRKRSGGIFGAIFGGSRGKRSSVSTSQVDASYSQKYSYSAEGASLLRTKLSPVPPPAILEERIRNQMEAQAERRQARLEAEDGDTT